MLCAGGTAELVNNRSAGMRGCLRDEDEDEDEDEAARERDGL